MSSGSEAEDWEGKYAGEYDENFADLNTKFANQKIQPEKPDVKIVDGSSSKSDKRIVPYLDISDNPGEVFVTRFSPDGNLLAAGCGDGAVRVFNTETGRLNYN